MGDDVVVETIRGLELGKIVKETETFLSNGMEIKPITRKATERDLKQAQENIEKLPVRLWRYVRNVSVSLDWI